MAVTVRAGGSLTPPAQHPTHTPTSLFTLTPPSLFTITPTIPFTLSLTHRSPTISRTPTPVEMGAATSVEPSADETGGGTEATVAAVVEDVVAAAVA